MWWLLLVIIIGIVVGTYFFSLCARSSKSTKDVTPLQRDSGETPKKGESQVLENFKDKAFSNFEGPLKPGLIPGCGPATISALKGVGIETGAQLFGLYLCHGGTDKTHGNFVNHVRGLTDELKHNKYISDLACGLQAKYFEMRRF